MAIFLNGTKIDKIYLNGSLIENAYYNGVRILQPSIVEPRGTIKNKILENATNIITERPDFSSATRYENSNLYKDVDEFGDTYYYRGFATNNYVYFAGFYWRIIRLNGNGSVRLLYDGTEPLENGASGTRDVDANEYRNSEATWAAPIVGYMYGNLSSTNYSQANANTYDSDAKASMDNWYVNNILPLYDSYIDKEAGFWCDRSLISGSGVGSEYPKSQYGAYSRCGKNPQFTYIQENDYFTVRGASKGNKALTYPIGLMTADEVNFSGVTGSSSIATNYSYIYSSNDTWTMTPHDFGKNSANGSSYGYVYMWSGRYRDLEAGNLTLSKSLRPVINLKGNTIVKGDGTISNPYTIDTSENGWGTDITPGKVIDKVKSNAGFIFTGTLSDSELKEPLWNENGDLWEVRDDLGTAYCFRGSVQNNYVKFANFWWRIVRINGNGSIRLVYDGTTGHKNDDMNLDRVLDVKGGFNSDFKYENSTIKSRLDTWFLSNLNNYRSYIDETPGFICQIGNIYSDSVSPDNTVPTLLPNSQDRLYTTANSTKGNKKLTYPIGLLTADEITIGGANKVYTNRDGWNFLFASYFDYMTMSWGLGNNVIKYESYFYDNARGCLMSNRETYYPNTYYLRPVINIKGDTIMKGCGTIDNPYELNVDVANWFPIEQLSSSKPGGQRVRWSSEYSDGLYAYIGSVSGSSTPADKNSWVPLFHLGTSSGPITILAFGQFSSANHWTSSGYNLMWIFTTATGQVIGSSDVEGNWDVTYAGGNATITIPDGYLFVATPGDSKIISGGWDNVYPGSVEIIEYK